MKRWESLTAVLCAAVLLCGFPAAPAFICADGGEGGNYGDPIMIEETTAPEPEPTIEPGEGFSKRGNLATRDLPYDEHTNKQSITVQTAGGNTSYIVTDYGESVGEGGERYETYFLDMTDEADLLAAAEAAEVERAVCSCLEKCAAGAVNTGCPVCAVNMAECIGVESGPAETEETGKSVPEEDKSETGGNMGMLLLVLTVVVAGGGAGWYFKTHRPEHEKAAKPEEDYGGEPDDCDGGEPYGDEEDDGPPWDEEDDGGEEADK